MKEKEDIKSGIVRWWRADGDIWEDSRLHGTNEGFYRSIGRDRVYIVVYKNQSPIASLHSAAWLAAPESARNIYYAAGR